MNPRSGFCKSNSTFYSKRKPISLPPYHSLDVTTFISSHHHHNNDKIAFIDASTGRRLSFGDFWRAVESVSICLSDMGIRKGHVVFLLSPNSIFFPIVCLSVMSLGAIITTANPLNTSQEISKQIFDSKTALIFTIPQLLPKLPSPESINNVPIVLMTTDHSSSDHQTLEDMMKKEPNDQTIIVKNRVTQNDAATLLFSSGTTGVSKGVISTHGNLIALVMGMTGRFRTHEKDQIYIATVPMFHTYGLAAFAISLVAKGCTVVVLPKFDLDEMLSAIHNFKVTYLPLVPPILVGLANNADLIRKKYDLRSLRYVLCGGAPLSVGVMEEFKKKFSEVTILQGYALTESNGAGASTETLEESRRHGTAGLITPSTEAKIVDTETGEALSENKTGELWLRGPSIMKGYFENGEATARTLTSDGWLKTGDLCYIDDDGFLFVVDRLKELIKYKAYQVPPAELESLLLTHPEIIDAAVIPFPDDKVGQYPMAYLVRRSGSSLSDFAVIEFVAKQVAPYKRIRRVAFVTSIPKNPSGKILRKDLIKRATSSL
ncbi:hypothetical protein ACH5RR_035305 [Cinchona calisaya]|uniref:4-coumarate--CoA ligase n=1 Tax=Cinchona calisaya TaxID=153742 RepID=A0ABD2YHG3_9GENT